MRCAGSDESLLRYDVEVSWSMCCAACMEQESLLKWVAVPWASLHGALSGDFTLPVLYEYLPSIEYSYEP